MDVFWYHKGQLEHVHERHLANNLAGVFAKHEKLWIDIPECSGPDLDYLKNVFGIHPRTIEEIHRSTTRPMVEEYDTYLSVVTYGLDERNNFMQLHFLLGRDFLITVHKHHIASFELLKRDAATMKQLLARDTEFVMHYLMSAEVDNYSGVLERFDDDIAVVEERVLHERSAQLVKDVFKLRHHLITLKHHIAPQKDVLYMLSRRGAKFVMPSCADLFRDVYMHIVYATDTIDNYRDILNGTLEVHLSVISNHLNDIIKVLTVFSTIFMPLTLIASIYGMNFENMPELHWHYGYFFALGFMIVIGIIMVFAFRRLKWM